MWKGNNDFLTHKERQSVGLNLSVENDIARIIRQSVGLHLLS